MDQDQNGEGREVGIEAANKYLHKKYAQTAILNFMKFSSKGFFRMWINGFLSGSLLYLNILSGAIISPTIDAIIFTLLLADLFLGIQKKRLEAYQKISIGE